MLEDFAGGQLGFATTTAEGRFVNSQGCTFFDPHGGTNSDKLDKLKCVGTRSFVGRSCEIACNLAGFQNTVGRSVDPVVAGSSPVALADAD
jgi:hypothetical protein